jgi:pyruvyltransferase
LVFLIKMLAWWWQPKNKKNFGDILNPVLIKLISGKSPKNVYNFFEEEIKKINKPIYVVIGSILQWATDKNSIIWGAGFISEKSKVKEKPKKICAVRGPLTRKKLLEQGVFCPKVYGDPVLLLPRFYNPNVKKKYKLGFVPHYVDKNQKLIQKLKKQNIKIINIEENYKKVIKQILGCEKIISSSLHALIVADAYKIPSLWVQISGEPGKFKFRDYFSSVGRKDKQPLKINEKIELKKIYNKFKNYKIEINLDKLMNACPFKNKNNLL